jgi:hypothetical protein
MVKNIGSTDKVVRAVVAVVLVFLYGGNVISGVVGIVGLVIAGMLIITSMVGFCGLYKIIGINTCPVESTQKESEIK